MIPKFLIVDDDKDDQIFLSTAICEIVPNAQVTLLNDGCEVPGYLRSTSDTEKAPDLIFLDLNMPKICGRVTTHMIREDLRFEKLPIVILSTTSDSEEGKKLLALGANAFYSKPSSMGEIKKIVSTVVTGLMGKNLSKKLKVA